jgi:hypothetical protein
MRRHRLPKIPDEAFHPGFFLPPTGFIAAEPD